MKKLLIGILVLSVLNLILLVLIYGDVSYGCNDFSLVNKSDTTINKIRIDSIEYVIKSKDSIINKIRYDENKSIEKANNLNDDDAVKLFKQLVSE